MESKVKELTEDFKSASRNILTLEIQNKEATERAKELSGKVKDQEKLMLETRNLDESAVELLAFDKNELELENNKLKNILDWKEKKFEEEKSKLEEQVKKLGGMLEQTNKSLQGTNSQLRERNIVCSQMEAELKTKVNNNFVSLCDNQSLSDGEFDDTRSEAGQSWRRKFQPGPQQGELGPARGILLQACEVSHVTQWRPLICQTHTTDTVALRHLTRQCWNTPSLNSRELVFSFAITAFEIFLFFLFE